MTAIGLRSCRSLPALVRVSFYAAMATSISSFSADLAGYSYDDQASLGEETRQLTELLRARNLSAVESMLEPCIDPEGIDYSTEIRCIRWYEDSVVLDEDFRTAIENWFLIEPENYHALMFKSQLLNLSVSAEKGLKPDEDTHPLHLYQAGLIREQNREVLETAVSVNPSLPYAYKRLLRNLLWTGTNEEIIQLRHQAIEQVPGSFAVAMEVLTTYRQRFGGSLETQQGVIQTYLKNVDRFPYLSNLIDYHRIIRSQDIRDTYGLAESPAQSLIVLKPLVEERPPWLELYIELADIYYYLDQPDRARNALLEGLALAPDNERLLSMSLCRCYGFKLSETLAAAERYTERYPTSFDGWARLGHKHYDSGDFLAAGNAYRRALAIRPYDPEVRLYKYWAAEEAYQQPRSYLDRPFFINLMLYSIPSYEFADDLAEQARYALKDQMTGRRLAQLERDIDRYLNRETFDQEVRRQLQRLDWNIRTWADVAYYFAERAHIADYLDDDFSAALNARFSATDTDHEVHQVHEIYQQVSQSMLADFIDRY